MHRNTFLLIAFLAVLAALMVGVNIGKRLSTTPQGESSQNTTASPTPSPQATTFISYTNTTCAFSIEYPDTLTILDSASGSAVLTDRNNAGDSIAITCQKDIPRSPLPQELIETVGVWNSDRSATISAKLYHDASAKDGKPMDVLIFRHPKTGLDVFLAGFGTTFQEVISSIKILQ